MSTTVIIGGVAGGMSAATRLRRRDEDMNIIVLEASGHVSFANCGLPYHISGTIRERSSLLLQTPESLKKRFNLDVRIHTRATAINPATRTVTAENTQTGEKLELSYDDLILSPGATPVRPPIPGIDHALSLRTVEDLDAIMAAIEERSKGTSEPLSAVLIGGGFIGLEVAENLTHRGLKVTVLERGDQIMGPLDPEMAAIITERLEEGGVNVKLGANTTKITDHSVHLESGEELPADLVIAAIGVKPASGLAKDAGLEIGERGGIAVNDQLRTSDPHIYALGDAAEKRDAISGEDTLVPLAQTANRHGRLVADIITGRAANRTSTLGTAIVGLFGLSAATVGWNEKRAVASGKNVRIIHLHPADHAAYYPGAAQIHLKLVVDANTDDILGAQAIGEAGADKRIDIIATAMRAGLKASDLADLELAYAPQFGSAKDPVNMAGFINDNAVNGEQIAQWHEIDALTQQGWTLVDVRTPEEFARGTIDGAINIQLDEIRDRIDEFRDKKALVFCQVGLRGHNAATLLSNLGVTATNITGGYQTWTYGSKAKERAQSNGGTR